MKKTGFNGYIYDFNTDYNAIVVSDMLDIQKYLMKKNGIRPEIININSNNPIFYPFSIKINKCSGNCNNSNHTYAKICVPDVIKDLNNKVFNLMSTTNETRFIKWHEKCKCKCRLDAVACNNKQRWNKNKCRCEWKELID